MKAFGILAFNIAILGGGVVLATNVGSTDLAYGLGFAGGVISVYCAKLYALWVVK